MQPYLKFLENDLEENDFELKELVKEEYKRQKEGLELIASENFTSYSVMECLGSCLTNKYSEGIPLKRYYGGNEVIDKIEILCQQRALKAFNLREEDWGVNVQPYSGSPANLAVFVALLNPHDRIMGLNLPDGGHLTHGFMSKAKRVSATSLFWESMPYFTDKTTGYINYEEFEKLAAAFKPKLIIAGFSAYPRHLDFKRFREVADSVGAILMADIAHVAGLVAAGLSPSPFEYCHVVTTTTHKTLRGPRSGVIFYRKDNGPNYSDLGIKINNAVFPGLQGGPHDNVIAAVATAMKQVATPEFRIYAQKIIDNCKAMERTFLQLGYDLATGGTDNHLLLLKVTSLGLDGSVAEKALEKVGISVNKNSCPGDTNMYRPSGIRVGSAALTSRGMVENDMIFVVNFIHDVLLYISGLIKSHSPIPTGAKFEEIINEKSVAHMLNEKKEKIREFASKFPLPGIKP